MKIKKMEDRVVVVDGFGEVVRDVEIELIGAGAEDILRINGMIFHLKGGKRAVPLTVFKEKNDIKIHTDGAWYALEGIERRGNALVLSGEYVSAMLTQTIVALDAARRKIKELENEVTHLKTRCSGEDFM